MYADVVDLREFYQSPLGHAVRAAIRAKLADIWPQVRGERILALGYGVPLLRPLLDERDVSLIAMMPAEQGVAYWPREGPNMACLAETGSLPLPDGCIDRAILMHALEGTSQPTAMLREVWRVLKGNGRLLAIVPNRRGLWAHSDRTPFGTGRPYSGFQIKDMLRDHGFLVERMWRALYLPPSSSRLVLSMADYAEKYGNRLFPGFGGVLLTEAGKQVYAPLGTKSAATLRRLVLPLPSSSGALPAG